MTLTPPAEAAPSGGVHFRRLAEFVGTDRVRRLSQPGPVGTAATALLAVMTMVVFSRQLFDGWTFPWDFLGTYSTTPAFVAATIGTNHLVAWNPFVASGFPAAVSPQTELYYPVWWIFGILGIPLTLGRVTDVQVLHVFFGAAGVLALARVRRIGWPWGIAAAVAYLLFGGFYGEAEHADIFRGFAYLPWLLWILTPPPSGVRWRRLIALPPLVWLIASGAYPAQLVSFSIVGAVYLAVGLYVDSADTWRRRLPGLLCAVGASAATAAAVLLPYLLATHDHQLFRAAPPTAAIRAGESIAPVDLFGLYLNSFAWQADGTVTAWAVGVPILIGLACVRLTQLRRQAPLVAGGLVALALAMTPKIAPIGKAMVALGFLFPSRFPAADYKAMVAIALILLSTEAWGLVASRQIRIPWAVIPLACALGIGAALAPSGYAAVTRTPWLLALVLLACVALALARPRPLLFAGLLVTLVIIDGWRDARDDLSHGTTSSWIVTKANAAPERSFESDIAQLPALLTAEPRTRPARIPPVAPFAEFPTGTNNDSIGWLADGYHLNDYTGTIENSLWQAENNPTWRSLLLKPWHAFVFPCSTVGCRSGSVHLPPAASWRPSPVVQTLSYGASGITYTVDISRPELMVENELAIDGWHTDSARVSLVDAHIPLRAWRLAAGRYTFRATYEQPAAVDQELAVSVALVLWAGCAWTLRRRRDSAQGDARPSAT